MSGIYKDKATGHRVSVSDISETEVRFCNQGGGFVKVAPKAAFFDRFELAETPEPFRKFLFTGDWLEVSLLGYSNGDRWNGWAKPFVTKNVAIQLIALMAHLGDSDDDSYRFRWDGETLMFWDPQEKTEFPISPDIIQTEDGELALYDFSFSWCWDFDSWVADGSQIDAPKEGSDTQASAG